MRLLIMVLVVAAVAAPAQTARADDARDAQCVAYARDYVVQVGFTAEQIAVVSGCAQTAAGVWFWPLGVGDPIPPILSEKDIAKTQQLRIALQAQLDIFHAALASMYDSLNAPADARPNLDVSLAEYTAGAISAEWGVPERVYQSAQGGVNSTYGDLLARFITDPGHIILRDYVDWWVRRRVGAVPQGMESQMDPLTARGLVNRLGVHRAPWPWELDRAYTLDLYLRWALDTGRVAAPIAPSSPPTPTPASSGAGATGAADCTADMGAWLGATAGRARAVVAHLPQGDFSPHPSPTGTVDADRNAAAITALADEQERSNPPDAARAVSALFVKAWRGYARFWTGRAAADAAGDQAAWDAANTLYLPSSADQQAAWTEMNRLKAACGSAS